MKQWAIAASERQNKVELGAAFQATDEGRVKHL